MPMTALYALAAIATVATAVATAARVAMKWRERRRYGLGPPVYDLTGQRVTWARRTGAAGQGRQRMRLPFPRGTKR
jgi:hypothetical protein